MKISLPEQEHEIIALFKAGNEKVFEYIFQVFYSKLIRYAETFLGYENPEVEDIVIQIFHKLFLKHQDFESLAKIGSFLYTAVKHTCLNYLKSTSRQGIKKKNWAVIQDFSDYQISLVEKEIFHIILDTTTQLPKRSKQVIELILLNNLSDSEISQILNMPKATVRSNKRHAVKILQKLLAGREILVYSLMFPISHMVPYLYKG